jgi:hypothetical protein
VADCPAQLPEQKVFIALDKKIDVPRRNYEQAG